MRLRVRAVKAKVTTMAHVSRSLVKRRAMSAYDPNQTCDCGAAP
jgi:hypothetical protein